MQGMNQKKENKIAWARPEIRPTGETNNNTAL